MVCAQAFCELLAEHQLTFFCGVPDSLLKPLCNYWVAALGPDQHIITANEGSAVALAAGHYLGSGRAGVVYMQNSGFGNALNPLVSLADDHVVGIPMLLMIGWRGEPGQHDEPQHIKQGAITEAQLTLLDIPYVVIDAQSDVPRQVQSMVATMTELSRPVALLVKKNTFSFERGVQAEATHPAVGPLEGPCDPASDRARVVSMRRETALRTLLSLMSPESLVVATTGKTSRELFELRAAQGETARDFLTVGAMGHTASLAMGIAHVRPDKPVIALDGDGSLLMHMGAMAVIAQHNSGNLIHVVLNNACHESVGGQPTVADRIDISAVAKGVGYAHYFYADCEQSLKAVWQDIAENEGPILLEIGIVPGSRQDLGRPTQTPKENKMHFMQHSEATLC